MSDALVEGVSGAIGGCVATIATFPLMKASLRSSTCLAVVPSSLRLILYPSLPPQISARQATRVQLAPTLPRPTDFAQAKAFKRIQWQQLRQQQQEQQQGQACPHQGTVAELLETVRSSGWRSLFSGLSAALVGTTVSQGVYFYLYSLLRQAAVKRRNGVRGGSSSADLRSAEVSVAETLLVAALAGAGNVLLTNPIWTVATRMQTHSHNTVSTQQQQQQQQQPVNLETGAAAASAPAPGPVSVARQVYREYGVPGFWNGVTASLFMVVNPTIQYAIYEWLQGARARLKGSQGGGTPGPRARPGALEVFLLSATAKAGATVLTYPMMTIKTRMMSARREDAELQYKSITDALAQILRREGVAGYYKGIRTKIVQSMLAAALLFMCKEKITDATLAVMAPRRAAAARQRGG
jgi:solute carrier family 25 (peroxisomal adenine nucleotide transporter), member 17